MKRKPFSRTISALAGATMAALALAGAAQAQNLSDLVGMNTERAHQILASRGYQQMGMDPGSSGNRYFWWNGARAGCVAISGYYGRVARVDVASPMQCGIGPGPGNGYGDIPGLRAACAAAADRYWRVRPGSSTTGRAHDLGYGYRIRVQLGDQSAHCVITRRGQVQSID
jgi:hypothetical protein